MHGQTNMTMRANFGNSMQTHPYFRRVMDGHFVELWRLDREPLAWCHHLDHCKSPTSLERFHFSVIAIEEVFNVLTCLAKDQ